MPDDAHDPLLDEVQRLRTVIEQLKVKQSRLTEQVGEAHEVGEQLWQDNQELRTLLHSMFDGFITLDPDWRITSAHVPATRDIPGAVRDAEAIGRNLWELFPDIVGTPAAGAFHRARDDKTLVEFEHYYPPWRLWFHVRAYPFQNSLHVCYQNITERKLAEAAMRQSEERFRTLFEQSPRAVNIARAGIILQMNRASRQLFGYRRDDEKIGASVLSLVTPECRPLLDERTRLREQGAEVPSSYEIVGLRADGASFPLLVEVARIALPDGPASVAFLTDLTDQHRAEEQRLSYERRLAEAKKWESLAAFAGGMAHDFNNLLSVVLGHAGLARMDLPADSPVRPCLDGIETAIRRAAQLTNQMLAYAGKGRFVLTRSPLNPIVEAALGMLGVTPKQPPEVQRRLTSEPLHVEADADQLRQMVFDLLANAVEAVGSHPNGIVTVTTTRQTMDRAMLVKTLLGADLQEGDYVLLEVTDNGCGMDAVTQARMFEPFFSTKFTGRGLGLAAALGIIRGHRGTLRVTSAPNHGTTVQVWIPSVVGEETG